jgi:hypothetical protein
MYGWTLADSPGELAMIHKGLLRVDSRYQRELTISRVVSLASEWSWVSCGSLTVAKRGDESLWVVDGQHRVKLCELLGITHIECRIHSGLTYEKEAQLYLDLNNPRKKTTKTVQQKWNASIEANDKSVFEMKNAIIQNGFKYPENQSQEVNKILALDKIHIIYRNVGVNGLNRVLYLIKNTWDNIFEAVNSHVIMGVYLFVKNYGNDFENKDFIKKMSKIHPRDILLNGKSNKQFSASSSYTPYGIAIWYEFNKGRVHKLPNKFELFCVVVFHLFSFKCQAAI